MLPPPSALATNCIEEMKEIVHIEQLENDKMLFMHNSGVQKSIFLRPVKKQLTFKLLPITVDDETNVSPLLLAVNNDYDSIKLFDSNQPQ